MTIDKIDRKEILRYLGYHGSQADKAVTRSVEESLAELFQNISPHSEQRRVPVTFGEEYTVQIGSITVRSKDLSQHLKGCTQAILFAATLGAQTDILMRRWTKLDMSRAVILQACAATVIEAYCDECEEELSAMAAKEGLFLRHDTVRATAILPWSISVIF
jgi:hypothetical protein